MKSNYLIAVVFVLLIISGIAVYYGRTGDKNIIQVTDFESCARAGYPVMESYPERCSTPLGTTFTRYIGNELEKSDLIRLDNPRPNQSISSPLELQGQARGFWFFEASFPARLLDANGTEIAVIPVTALGEWMTTEFVPFRTVLNFPKPTTATGTLILEKDNPSGLPAQADSLIVPVRFSSGQPQSTIVKVYFARSGQADDCGMVSAVSRDIPATAAIGRAALLELLKGPTSAEIQAGYLTSLNPGVVLKDLRIENGVARADFSEELDRGIGGSCRVTSIRAQITETLKQFNSVRDVVITINGREDDILQP